MTCEYAVATAETPLRFSTPANGAEGSRRRLSALLADALARPLGIPAERVYVRFADVAAADWGWNKSTFG